MNKEALREILKRPNLNSYEFIELVDENATSQEFWSWVNELLLERDEKNQPLAFIFAQYFGRLSGDAQRAVLASRFSTVEVLTATSERGNSVAGILLNFSPIAIYHFGALQVPEVYKSGHDSTTPVLSLIAKILGYKETKAFLKNDDFDSYLALGNKHEQIPAFSVCCDPDFLATGLQFRPDIYNYSSGKLDYRIANMMHGFPIFEKMPVDQLINIIVDLAMKQHPYPCRGKLDQYVEGSNYILRQSLMLLREEFECLPKSAEMDERHDIAQLHACFAVACHRELNEATELLIHKTIGEIIERSNAEKITVLLTEIGKFPSFRGRALLEPILTLALNNKTLLSAVDTTTQPSESATSLELY